MAGQVGGGEEEEVGEGSREDRQGESSRRSRRAKVERRSLPGGLHTVKICAPGQREERRRRIIVLPVLVVSPMVLDVLLRKER